MLTAVTTKYLGCIEFVADKLFVSSFFLNKIKDFPFPLVKEICTNMAIFCLALAYTLQIFSSPFYQNQGKGYYSHRALLISSIGALTAWTCIMFPELWLICTWLFCLNNLTWIYNELSRLQAPTLYPQMPKNQWAYCCYVVFVSLAGLVSALSNTFGLGVLGLVGNWLLTGLGLISLHQSKHEPTVQSMLVAV